MFLTFDDVSGGLVAAELPVPEAGILALVPRPKEPAALGVSGAVLCVDTCAP